MNVVLRTAAIVCIPLVCLTGPPRPAGAGEPASPAKASPFRFTLQRAAPLTSAGVYAPNGRLVRQLWAMKPLPAGEHTGEWDGSDEFGRPAPAGPYTWRVVANHATYRNVGILGNTGVPHDEPGHIQHGVLDVTVDARGRIYTANGWEEAGHDFKVQDPDGNTLFHARYQIRNGNPNGAPHAIAVDDTHIYCATHGWASEQWKSKQQIQRFRITDGNHEAFTEIQDNAGHIQLYAWPEKQVPEATPEADAALMRLPVRAIAVCGEAVLATDALGGKVHTFHKTTGKALGEFPVRLPHALAVDCDGRLWIGHEHRRVSIFTAEGKRLATPLDDVGKVASLNFGPDGLLYVADAEAGQVRVYQVKGNAVEQVRSFGKKARPGDRAPDRFYDLRGAAVDPQGRLVTIQSLPSGGARIARFAPDGTCLWEHMALMFCDVGNVAPWRPDEFISHRFHRMILTDKNAGRWEYRGTILDGDPKYIDWQHGVLRLLKLGDAEFFLQCYGDGIQVYRRGEQGLYRLATMVGGHNPLPDGRYNDRLPKEQRRPLGQWTWTDSSGNGAVEDNEVVWFKKPGEGRYAVFGMNVDARGDILYCDHHTHAIWQLPLARLDKRGSPVYDWGRARQIVPRDESPVKFFPLMALRADDGTIYAFGRSDAWQRPGGKTAGYAWMGGWALCRYEKDGKRLWAARLPQVCVGMDAIPGGRGVMLGYFEKAHVYHYTPEGLLIGMMKPGDAAGSVTGWMDNTSAVAVSRDPRDGLLDVFGEDSWLNRNVWYRVDDRDVRTLTGALVLKP